MLQVITYERPDVRVLLHVVFAGHAWQKGKPFCAAACRRTVGEEGGVAVVSAKGGVKHQAHVLEVALTSTQ